MLGVVTGLRSEARLLRGLDVACISVGGRAEGAPEKIEALIRRGVTGLVSFGIAGALHPDLRAGDDVIGTAVMDESGATWRAADAWVSAVTSVAPRDLPGPEAWYQARPPRPEERVNRGPLSYLWESQAAGSFLGLDRILASPQDKAAAFARTGALAIDMESHHVARAAAAHGLPFIAIRAISDRADEALPACFADFVDAEGGTKMSAVLAALISGRISLRELLAAGRSSRLAHQTLLRCRGAVAGLR
ncbi:MAG TPA: hypothetical protein PLR41_10350 [Alphaproteobacteria bacterium]|nr:hypothetical protein [Alphaproteobacteria bacterium]